MNEGRLRNTDVPGNVMASQAAYVKQLVRHAEALLALEQTVDHMFDEEWLVQGISVRFPQDDRPDYLVVVRAVIHGQKQVAFHDAPTFLEAVVGMANRLKNRSMKFKEDTYG